MKTLTRLCVLLLAFALLAGTTGFNIAQAQVTAVAPDIVGPHYCIWSFGAAGPQAQVPGTPLAMLETGMNHFDLQNRQWLPSVPLFVPGADGQSYVATQVQHRLRLGYQLNTTGAVSVRMDDGLALDSTPVALALYEPASGNFAVIASLTNTTAQLTDTNQVLYADVFGGEASGVCCNFRFTIEKGTLSQDCIVTGKLDPRDWGFSTNCWVQVMTEFYGNVPQPQQTSVPTDPVTMAAGLNDSMLEFGQFVLASGRAYTEPTSSLPGGGAVAVTKQWVVGNNRVFLVESLPYARFMAQFLALPECGSAPGQARLNHPTTTQRDYASVPRPPGRTAAAQVPRPEQRLRACK